MTSVKRKILNIFLILIIGGLGGILADQFLLPYLAVKPPFSNIDFIHQASNGTTIVNPTEEIIIRENQAVEKAIQRIGTSLVLIKSIKNNRLISQGTGFVMTSDGLLITAGDVISAQANEYLVYKNGNNYQAELVKKDLAENIALLKIEATGLSEVTLAELEKIKLGERVILVGADLIDSHLIKFVNLGIVRSISQGVLKLNFQENNLLANGSPLINIQGEVIGMNLIDQQGWQKTVPNKIISEFISL